MPGITNLATPIRGDCTRPKIAVRDIGWLIPLGEDGEGQTLIHHEAVSSKLADHYADVVARLYQTAFV